MRGISHNFLQASIDAYLEKYQEFIYNPQLLKQRMERDIPFALDQLGQRTIFPLLQNFIDQTKAREEYKNIDLSIKIHFIIWDEALDFLKKEAENPTFSIAQIGSDFLGGLAESGNILSLNQYIELQRSDTLFFEKCLKTCKLENKQELLALPFWASMRAFYVRKDIIDACEGINADSIFTDWRAFERTGKIFNSQIRTLRQKGFRNIESFWEVNVSDRDLNILQTLAPAIFSYGGEIIKDKFWWKEFTLDKDAALSGIKNFIYTAKSICSLNEFNMGRTLDQFHAGRFAVVLCGTWDHSYWRNTNPDSSLYIEIHLPPRGSAGQKTLLTVCNLILFKQPDKKDYSLEYELIHYLATDPKVQSDYIIANDRLSGLKSAQNSQIHSEYYKWLLDDALTKSLPNNKEIYKLLQYLTQKYYLASMWQNVKGANELTDDVWNIIKNGIKATTSDLNRQIIPNYIYYTVYTKINLIYIILFTFLLGFIGFKLVKGIKTLKVEKAQIETNLSNRLKSLSEEKTELMELHRNTQQQLEENVKLIGTLSKKLNKINKEYEQLKNEASLEKLSQLSLQIHELTSQNKRLHADLSRTHAKIQETENVVSKLETQLSEYQNPEIYIDFNNKTIYKMDGTEFVLSSSAKQYKNDVFRYLEYIVRYNKRRVHLIEFGLNDAKFFIDAVKKRKVREYNYVGKFAKVKSGINKTFMENIGKELILQDKENIYVYYDLPHRILKIASKENDIDIQLFDINKSKKPEVIPFWGYENFDYYRINHEITIKSTIHDAANHLKAALNTNDDDEKLAKLDQALSLDNKNYAALLRLLDMLPFNNVEMLTRTQQKIESEIENLQMFLSNELIYDKKITNLSKIKNEFKEIYSWKYVNTLQKARFNEIGQQAFRQILEFEIDKIKNLVYKRKDEQQKIQKYFGRLEKIKIVWQYFGVIISKSLLITMISEWLQIEEVKKYIIHNDELNENRLKNYFVNFLIERLLSDDHISKTRLLADRLFNLCEWIHTKKLSEPDRILVYLEEFFEKYNIHCNQQKYIKRLCHRLIEFTESDLP